MTITAQRIEMIFFPHPLLMRLALLMALLLCPASPLYAWQGQVVRVVDGDTIHVTQGKTREKIRLYGIDSPERQQAYGPQATRYAQQLLQGKTVRVEEVDRDRYGRLVAIIWLGQQNINQMLVEQGYAWVYSAYCKKGFCSQWHAFEAEARAGQKGLWADNKPVPPWEWRKSKRDKSVLEQLLNFIEDVIRWARKIMSYLNLFMGLFE